MFSHHIYHKMHQTKSEAPIVTLSWSFCALVDVFRLKTEVTGGKHKLEVEGGDNCTFC